MSLSEILQDLPRLIEAERQELREVLDSYDPERERAWAQLARTFSSNQGWREKNCRWG